MKKVIIGVMGPGPSARQEDIDTASELGRLIAGEGWVLLTGGMGCGVMDAANRGASEAGGLTVGVLPTGDHGGMSSHVDIPIVTGMGSARNNINVLSSDVVIACGMGPGTASEAALAIKAGKTLVLIGMDGESKAFFSRFQGAVSSVDSPQEAIDAARRILKDKV